MPPASHPRIAVAVCDANEISRLGIARLLTDHGITVVAEAADGEAALRLAATAAVDVMLVDVALPPAPGAAAAVLATAAERTVAIAMGVDGAPEPVFAALRAGAAGYLTKDLAGDRWAGAIQAAVRGESPLSRTMTALLVERFRQVSVEAPLAQMLPSDRRLTQRELEVLECIADGKTNRATAAELSISVETVRTHVSNILAKLEAPSRSAAAARLHQLRAVLG
jgi:DNA-binding NarL/FixJ family response regulator